MLRYKEDIMIKILIFGAGEAGRKIIDIINEDKVTILAYIDNDVTKQGQLINGKIILNPQAIYSFDYDYIVIASMYQEEIYEQLIEMGIDKNRILVLKRDQNRTSHEQVKQLFIRNNGYLRIFKEDVAIKYVDNLFICNMHVFTKKRNVELYKFRDYLLQGVDYVRVSTLELIAREIYDKKVSGAVAELGVYRGDFTKVISTFFNDRKLYLFDTFEGFPEKDIEIDKSKNYSDAKVERFKDTNIEIVLNKIEHKNDVYIKKGYFPDTAVSINNESFAFVSIDVDLFKPTYDGLCFFYSKLTKGGYILIHDYNNSYYSGVKEAVNKFCKEKNVTCIPVSDYLGSAIITK